MEHKDAAQEPGDAAGAADRPVPLDELTDPNVPLLSAHVSFDAARRIVG